MGYWLSGVHVRLAVVSAPEHPGAERGPNGIRSSSSTRGCVAAETGSERLLIRRGCCEVSSAGGENEALIRGRALIGWAVA